MATTASQGGMPPNVLDRDVEPGRPRAEQPRAEREADQRRIGARVGAVCHCQNSSASVANATRATPERREGEHRQCARRRRDQRCNARARVIERA